MEPETAEKPTSMTDTFLSKLKEQSFAILLCLGIVYYQHQLMQTLHQEMTGNINACQAKYETLIAGERDRLITREAYLIKQRDEFIEIVKKFKVE